MTGRWYAHRNIEQTKHTEEQKPEREENLNEANVETFLLLVMAQQQDVYIQIAVRLVCYRSDSTVYTMQLSGDVK